ncbi:MAG: NADH:ubiquinone reductase (Na(+)-transporting) subunit F [Porphyromonadaceae bacterium]|jgi:NADH:ubiquinone oxidoreductase, F subunit|uniref:Na(+)-translocating NADH-quinone reductase subunit F n=1 Tax=Porphyromonas pasteri TaxID=1583331 RepID=A0ABQ2H956_9PORP|nr:MULTISPECIES: NADH:ubiquinone reductase (Na(+)-transporting) subunit F [Porphyromonas]MBF1289537.1 NADH:ubiquinone reductase (Na(+)-transporting) subunit F [Porphyromonadaceae bacterium]MBF1308719.1 NADH:ubiquinone reductase (Na(+)-transporting) subunit F [Porphyromonadaceae bacterium]MBF1316567.1 NADH:ubiquinone reductase (Na(+)-transporting) subunit F [Porphyromonadaceae bacterium]MBF1364941.1 NADH:ubiquinone reductase (Na(+)-transporting) subunit F [Porphyromonadaceae bacterium]MBF136855
MNTTIILVSVGIFLVVTLLLVIVLLVAKSKLVPSGNVKLTINGEKEAEVPIGGTLLSTLQGENIYLSSACGGSGSCGQCRCRVVEGGGEILPTETGFFSRKEQKEHWRLACQTKVKEDMQVIVPESVFGVKEWECEVVSNRNVSTFIKEFVVKLPEGEVMNFQSGSYAQITIPPYDIKYADYDIDEKFRGDWDHFDMWSLTCKNDTETIRAYSMANYPAEGNIITLNVRIATPPMDRATHKWLPVSPGISSSYIFSLKPGDKVRMSGPYGDFHIQDTDAEMLYIGGGAGMAPLRAQILHLFRTLHTGRKVSYWYGARSKKEIFYEEDFREIEKQFPNFSFHIALSDPQPEDNWTGYVGFIHQVIYDNYLKDHDAPEDIEYYMCGPGPMANAVKKMLEDLGVERSQLFFDDFGG